MRTAAVFLSLMQAQDLPELYARAAEGAMAHLGAEGAYLLRLEAGRYRVVGAAGTAGLARGLRLPPEWEPREGTTPPPGPLGFSPDGKRRLGHMARRGSLVLALEGVGPLGEEKEVLEALLEAVALREGRMAGLSTLEVLLSLSRRLRQGASLAEEIRGALEVLLERTGLEVGVLFRLEGEAFRPWVLAGVYPPDYPELYRRHAVRLGMGATALLKGRDFAVIPDYQTFPHALPPMREAGLRTVVLALLERAGKPYGALALASFARPVEVSPEGVALLRVAREELEGYLERRLQTEGLLMALSAILERLDYETEGHMRRVAELAVALGERAGVKDLECLRIGAYLHDLGKLFVPREILDKDGPLVTREWRLVKTHPELGYEVLARVPFLSQAALEVVLYHHEHWDGTGYPRGLKGEEIPLHVRVFAVADVWDALVSPRPYKPAYDPKRAEKELRAMAGKKLDPRLVQLFLTLRAAREEVKKR
ncbi:MULTISPECIES: HD-GYP domain-containing protein [Thermus]|jgi:HD-GYP domain-containing protein (c-di-GMP phosphodiesterase class II)|uniref:HD domain-containing protein n=1 Tax=Thermus brockianus TaxID=56956 RepID=A0A1J0LWC5_THEBO|nr:HD-GYP domain-containing protein [Thermus brockianus]APD10434.1 HD domain-containing protein [Thermus brockianus]